MYEFKDSEIIVLIPFKQKGLGVYVQNLLNYFGACGEDFFFFTSTPGTAFLRASCLTLRLCLACPLEGRFFFVFVVVVSMILFSYFLDS